MTVEAPKPTPCKRPIAELDTPDVDIDVDAAESDVRTAESDVDEADIDVRGAESDVRGAESDVRGADIDVDGAEPAKVRSWSRVTVLIGALLCAICVAALVVGGIFGGSLLSDKHRDDDRAAALAAGRQVAVNLSTIDYATGRQDIQRILSTGTGDFANQFQANVDSYLDLVNQAQVVSTGKVAESGITSLDGNDAKVLVAITSTVKNKDDKAGEDRWYRMSVELQRQGDGRWLASRVEFVQ